MVHRKDRENKKEEVKVYWISPKLLGLLDFFMHKAAYWSVHNYEKRVDAPVRTSFLKHVEDVHHQNRDALAGMSSCASIQL